MTDKRLLEQYHFEAKEHELAAAIVRAGMTQGEFAERIGYSEATVSKVLNHQRKARPEFIRKTLEVLTGYTREDLFVQPTIRYS